jgi:hypothetical protein
MDIAILRLMGLDIWQTENTRGINEIQLKISRDCPVKELFTYRSDNVLHGFHAFWKIDPHLPDFWKDKVEATYLRWENNREYLTWVCMIDLQPDVLGKLGEKARESPKDYIIQLDTLFDAIFPPWAGNRAQPTNTWPRFAYMLYLEPQEAITLFDSRDVLDIDHVWQVMEALQSLSVWKEDHASLPHLLHNVLFLFGLGPYRPTCGVTALSLQPLWRQGRDTSLVLPRLVMSFLEYMTYFQIMKHLRFRLKQLPFSLSLSQYIAQLKSGEEISTDYEERFLKDRQDVISERLSIKQSVQAFSRELALNPIARAVKSAEGFPLDMVSTSPYRYRYFAILNWDFTQAKVAIKEALAQLISHENALADYLRDISTATVNRSNLQLQRSTRWLAQVALIVAFIGLFVGILPEDAKKMFYETLQGLLRALSPTEYFYKSFGGK